MEKDKLQKERCFDGNTPYYILKRQDFVLVEGKKDKKENKKSRPKVKDFKEFIDDNEDEFIDPNDNPERFIKIREQFIKDEL